MSYILNKWNYSVQLVAVLVVTAMSISMKFLYIEPG